MKLLLLTIILCLSKDSYREAPPWLKQWFYQYPTLHLLFTIARLVNKWLKLSFVHGYQSYRLNLKTILVPLFDYTQSSLQDRCGTCQSVVNLEIPSSFLLHSKFPWISLNINLSDRNTAIVKVKKNNTFKHNN